MKRAILFAAMTIGTTAVFAQQNPLDGNGPVQQPVQQRVRRWSVLLLLITSGPASTRLCRSYP